MGAVKMKALMITMYLMQDGSFEPGLRYGDRVVPFNSYHNCTLLEGLMNRHTPDVMPEYVKDKHVYCIPLYQHELKDS